MKEVQDDIVEKRLIKSICRFISYKAQLIDLNSWCTVGNIHSENFLVVTKVCKK